MVERDGTLCSTHHIQGLTRSNHYRSNDKWRVVAFQHSVHSIRRGPQFRRGVESLAERRHEKAPRLLMDWSMKPPLAIGDIHQETPLKTKLYIVVIGYLRATKDNSCSS